jgi:hypothetical protein
MSVICHSRFHGGVIIIEETWPAPPVWLAHGEDVHDFNLFHRSPLEAQCVVHIENLAGPCSRCPIKDSTAVLGDSSLFYGEGGLPRIPEQPHLGPDSDRVTRHSLFQRRAHGTLSSIGL